jgi:hypothetical protein
MEYISRKNGRAEVQRQEDHWNEVHEQMMAVQKKPLAISDPQDSAEREADEVASKVMQGQSVEITNDSSSLNRKGEGSMEVTSDFQSQLNRSNGSGQPLDKQTQEEMGAAMNADFSGVKTHTDSTAAALSAGIDAKAFTLGQNVYFGSGYTPENKELLAHELVHTVQQGKRATSIQRLGIELPSTFLEAITFNQTQTYLPSFSECLEELYFLNGNRQLYTVTLAAKRNDREFAWMTEEVQQYLKRFYPKTKVTAKYDDSTTATIKSWIDSRAAWNKKYSYSNELIDKLASVINDVTGKLIAKVKAEGTTTSRYFAYLVLMAQRSLFYLDGQKHDGAYGPTTESALNPPQNEKLNPVTYNWNPTLIPNQNYTFQAQQTLQGAVLVPVFQKIIPPIFATDVVWSGDSFAISMEDTDSWDDHSNFRINITYTGKEIPDSTDTWIIVSPPKNRSTAFNVYSRTFAHTDEYGTTHFLYLDLFGNGKCTYLIKDHVWLNQNWSPAGRTHNFLAEQYGTTVTQSPSIYVQDRLAVPSKTAAKTFGYSVLKTPTITGDPILNSAKDALSKARFDVDSIVANSLAYGISQDNAHYWWVLQKNVNAAYESAISGTGNDQSMLKSASALSRMINYVKLKLVTVSPFMDANFHPQGISEQAVQIATNVHTQFDKAVFDSFTDLTLANKELIQADSLLQTMGFQLATLYLDKDRGMEQEVSALQETIDPLIAFRDAAGLSWNLPNIDKQLGVQKPAGSKSWLAEAFRDNLSSLRTMHQQADPSTFAKLMLQYQKLQYHQRIAQMVSTYELFRYYHHAATNGLIAKGVDLVWPDHAGDKSQWYIDQLEPHLKKVDMLWGKLLKGESPTKDEENADDLAVKRYVELITADTYKTDLEFIETRLQTIATVKAVLKALVIIVLAAAAGAAAGAFAGAIAAELGASAGTIAFTEFVVNTLVFTTVDFTARKYILGETDISFGTELFHNFMFFGLLRGASVFNKFAFTKFIGDPKKYKRAWTLTNTTATMVELHGLSWLQFKIANPDKPMPLEQHYLAAFQNFTMLAATHLGAFLVESPTQKWNAKTQKFLLENFKTKVQNIEKSRLELETKWSEYKTRTSDTETNAELLEAITKQFNAEVELLERAKKDAGKDENTKVEIEKVIASYEQRLASFQLELALNGFAVDVGNVQMFRYVETGLVSYKDGADIGKTLDAYYKEKGGTYEKDKSNPDVYHGKAGLETTTFVPESRVNDYAKSTGYKVIPLVVEEAIANTKTPEEAVKYVSDKLKNEDAKDMFDLLNEKQTDKQQFIDDLSQRERTAVGNEISLERSLAIEAETNPELFAKRTGAKEAPGEPDTFTYNGSEKSLEYIKKYHKGKTVTGPDADGTITVTGKKSSPIKYVTEQRFKEIQLENRFGKTEASKAKPDIFKISAEAFYRLIPQCRNIEDVNRLYDVIEKRSPGELEKVQKLNFTDNYVEADGRSYIYNAEHINDPDLALKVRDNPVQSAAIDKILSEINDVNERAQLQKDIAALTDSARQLFLDLQGKMNMPQTEVVKRASFGAKHGYNVDQTVDYYGAIDILTGINVDPGMQSILNERNTNAFGREKDSYRYESERLEFERLERELNDAQNPPKDPSEIKKQVRSLRNKLELENSAKELGDYIEQNNLGKKDAFDDAGAYNKLIEVAKVYIKSGGAEFSGFLEYLKSNPHLNGIKWTHKGIVDKTGKAFSKAMENMDVTVLRENDPRYLTSFENVTIGTEPMGEGGEKNVYEITGQPDLVMAKRKNKSLQQIKQEISVLDRLKALGFKVLEILGYTFHNGEPAMIMKRYAEGSKDIVKTNDETGQPERVGNSEFLNDQSIKDLKELKNKLRTEDVWINDIQFLIDSEGRIVLADIRDVMINKEPSKQNLKTIDLLIDAAAENVILFNLEAGKSYSKEQIQSILKGTLLPHDVNRIIGNMTTGNRLINNNNGTYQLP